MDPLKKRCPTVPIWPCFALDVTNHSCFWLHSTKSFTSYTAKNTVQINSYDATKLKNVVKFI